MPKALNYKIALGLATLAALAVLVLSVPALSKAMAMEFLLENQGTYTVTATTTTTFLTAGTSTTTPVFDTFVSGSGNTYATDKLALEIQYTASSTLSKLNWYYEYANTTGGIDCVATPTGCDWYADTQLAITNASTTQTIDLSAANKYNWTFASTTQGAAAIPASNNRALKIVTVVPAARYVRAVFTVPVGASAGAVWAAFIGQKQSTQ